MATAAAYYSSEETYSGAPRGVSKFFWPWLLSTATHLALMIGMALLWDAPDGAGLGAVSSSDGITLVHVDNGSAGGGDGGDGGPKVGQFFSDDDSQLSSSATMISSVQDAASQESLTGVAVHAGGELTALFDEAPPIDFSSILPAAGKEPAASTSNGAGDANGVASAKGMVGGTSGIGGKGGDATSGKGGVPGLGYALGKGAARTGVFGVSGSGYKFIYVFDRSGSMDGHGGAPLSAAKAELIHSLHELGKTHQFQIIFYNEHPRVFGLSGYEGKLVFGTDQTKRLAERFVHGITADGATQHEEALEMALRLNPDVIFFLTDADEPSLSANQLARIARMNSGTSINAIEFGYGPRSERENFLVRLARQNGGKHVYVDVAQLPRP